ALSLQLPLSRPLDDQIGQICEIAAHEQTAFPPGYLPAANEDGNADERDSEHDRNVDLNEVLADRDAAGGKHAGDAQDDEDVVDAAADQVADRDIALASNGRDHRSYQLRRGSADRD